MQFWLSASGRTRSHNRSSRSERGTSSRKLTMRGCVLIRPSGSGVWAKILYSYVRGWVLRL
eukprot:6319358-Heterocapsa_arctica.AAC.1